MDSAGVGTVVVAGLGPAGPDLLPAVTRAAVETGGVVWLRTRRHPAAQDPCLAGAPSCDDLYDAAGSLDEVYAAVAGRLVAQAAEHGRVLYLVPGSPLVAERSVGLLTEAAAMGAVRVELLPGVSFLELAWARLRIDPVAAGVRIVDGHRFAAEAAGERGPLLVAQCDSAAVLSDIKLAWDDVAGPVAAGLSFSGDGGGPAASEPVVTVLHHLGLPDEVVVEAPWSELDRTVVPDHLTSLWIPALAPPVAFEVVRFAELVATLRERCPWDRAQTHHSLARHLLEEAYEALEAIEALPAGVEAGTGDEAADAAFAHLEEELGDVLFQVVFHATLATEEGWFTLADVARGIHDKLVRRHPHVFGEVVAETPEAVVASWEQIKATEKGSTSVFASIPGTLPSLAWAAKVLRKAGAFGLDGPEVTPEAAAAVAALLGPADDGRGRRLGDALLALVAQARRDDPDADPEGCLRASATRFRGVAADAERTHQEQHEQHKSHEAR